MAAVNKIEQKTRCGYLVECYQIQFQYVGGFLGLDYAIFLF